MTHTPRTPQSFGWLRRPDLDKPAEPHLEAWERPDGKIYYRDTRAPDPTLSNYEGPAWFGEMPTYDDPSWPVLSKQEVKKDKE